MSGFMDISEIKDAILSFTESYIARKPRTSKKAQLDIDLVALQTWDVLGCLILAKHVIKLLIIVLLITLTRLIVLLHILMMFSSEFLQNRIIVSVSAAESYLNRFFASDS